MKKTFTLIALITGALSILLNVYIFTKHPAFGAQVLKMPMIIAERMKIAAVKKIAPADNRPAKPIVYRLTLKEISMVSPSAGSSGAKALPDNLVIAKGKYSFGDFTYELDKEGLYRFVSLGSRNEQRIVYSGDVKRLISSLSWILAHGKRDNGLIPEEITEKAKNSKVILVCGGAVDWTRKVLSGSGVKSRVVMIRSLAKAVSYNDKHLMLEVYDETLGKWVLYDIDNNVMFEYKGSPLSFSEFMTRVKEMDYTIERISEDFNLDISGFEDAARHYNFTFLFEGLMPFDDNLKKWYADIGDEAVVYDGEGRKGE